MRDQVKKLHDLGISAVSLSSGIERDEEAKALDRRRELFCIIWHSMQSQWLVLWLLMHEAHVSMYYNKS
jgi:superfamily II DNA helicase RecQ